MTVDTTVGVEISADDFAELVDMASQAPEPNNDGAIILGASPGRIAADLEMRRSHQQKFVAEMAEQVDASASFGSSGLWVPENKLAHLVWLAERGHRGGPPSPVVQRARTAIREWRAARQLAEEEASANYEPQVGEIWSTWRGCFYRIVKVTPTGLRLQPLESKQIQEHTTCYESVPTGEVAH